MSTPAPHTPVNFLKGGGNAMFSAECVKLLANGKTERIDGFIVGPGLGMMT